MSTNDSQVQTQPVSQDEVKSSVEAQAQPSPSKTHSNKSDASDGVLHVATEMKNARQKIGYLFAILKTDRPVTLKAYGSAIGKAIRIATVVRSKVGGLHQLVRLTESNDEKRGTQGIEIVLSASQLDQEAVGYHAPEAKGFWVPKKRERPEAKKAEPAKVDEAEVKKAAGPDAGKKDADDKPKKKRRQNRKKSVPAAEKPKEAAAVEAEASAEAKSDPAAAKEERSKSARAKQQRRNKRQRRPKTAEKEAEVSEAKENAKPARENSASPKKDADQHKQAVTKAERAQEKQFEGGQGARSRKPQQEQMKHEPRQQPRYPPQGNGRRPDYFRHAAYGGGGYYPYHQQQYQPPIYRQNYSRYFAGENGGGRAPYQVPRGGYRQNPTSYGGGGRLAPEQRRELTKWSEGRQQQQQQE